MAAIAMPTTNEAPRRTILASLPGEMQNEIIRQLDPIGLISLSQTDRYFRSIIRPNKREMAERLLILETQAMALGSQSRFGSSVPQMFRPFTDWESQLWACTGCLRLLPHIYFDTRSLKRLTYRKQWLRHPERLTTSWTPSLHGKVWGRTHTVAKRRQRHIEARMVDPVCGAKRWNRQCNECRYQSNILTPPSPQDDMVRQVPVQRSRSIRFKSHLVRWFPQLEEVLETESPPSPHGTDHCYCKDIGVEIWTMYMVRCPKCEKWQELREFRLAQSSWGHGGSVPPDVLCNACLGHEFGREALAEALLPRLKRLIEQQRADLELRLTLSSEALRCLEEVLSAWSNPIKKPILTKVWSVNCLRLVGIYNNLTLTALSMLHSQIQELRGSAPEEDHGWVRGAMEWNDEFAMWLHCFEECEAQWRWLAACEEEIDRDPDLLAAWALKRDGASFS